MLQKILDFFKSKKQKGQSLAFVAAAIPFLCLFLGASMDFGWMYYNQSRLQNAADAAAIGGAKTLIRQTGITDSPLSEYTEAHFVSNSDPGLVAMQEQSVISTRNKVFYDKNTQKPGGDPAAQIYAEANLKTWYEQNGQQTEKQNIKLITTDDVGMNGGYEKVKFESSLLGPNPDDDDAQYYTVTLTTKLQHLFGGIMDTFGISQLPSKATSAVKITYGTAGQNLFFQMKIKEQRNTFPNWEEIAYQKNGSGPANDRSVLTAGIHYYSGNMNRVEASIINGDSFKSSGGSQSVSKNDEQFKFDDLFIDFQGEMNNGLTANKDHDLDIDPSKVTSWQYGNSLSGNYQRIFRVHFPVMIIEKYHVRNDETKYGVYKDPPDPLFAFIEQEPIIQNVTYLDKSRTYQRGNMSSVRQIIINNDVANTNENTDRPIVFFYEGPEIPYASSEARITDTTEEEDWMNNLLQQKKQAHSNSSQYYDEDGDYIGERPFLPVILNLYADFRGILFIPNNPVVINGNGYKFEGFVVAREFRRLKTWKDFQDEKYTDTKKPVYVYPANYKGQESPFYAKVRNWKVKNSTNTSGYVSTKVNFNGTWCNAWVKNGQWYTDSNAKDPREYAQIEYSDSSNKKRYAKFADILLEVNLDSNNEVASSGTSYVAQYDGRYYTPIHEESVTYTGSNSLTSQSNIGKVFTVNNKTVTQKVPTMYISGTKYTYTETYLNTEGKQKTKTTIVNIGDVQCINVSASDASVDEKGNITGNYSETPRNHGTFADDDKLRFDYENVFNLKSNSTYNSFKNVLLRNYVYLKNTEKSQVESHDMFFTTARAKHIN